MIRARLAAEGLPAMGIKCEDARSSLAALVSGPVPLTEWALLESHLRRCARCRQHEARLRQLAVATRPVAPSYRVVALGRDLTPRARVGVMWARDLGIRCAGELMARLRTSLTTLRGASVAAGNAVGAVRRAARPARSARTLGIILPLAFTVCALPATDGPRPRAIASAPAPSGLEPVRLEAARVESAQPKPAALEPAPVERVRQASLPPAPSVEKRAVSSGPARTDQRRHAPLEAPRLAAAPSPPDVSEPSPQEGPASEPAPDVSSTTPTAGADLPVSASHVVGRLTAKNPRAAQRDFIALLADVGGTELGRNRRITFTSVEVVVPQSRYDEFAGGLARIGSWQLEAARSPLPDAVRMTIHLTD